MVLSSARLAQKVSDAPQPLRLKRVKRGEISYNDPMGSKKPSVYDYMQYRGFLRDIVEYLKNKNEYSNRGFAEAAGLKSHVHLHLIITGKKNASSDTLKKIAQALKLGTRETEFLLLLAQFAHAPNSVRADEVYQQILSAQGFLKAHRAEALEYRYYSNWRLIATLEALSTPWAQWPIQKQAESLQTTVAQLEKDFEVLSQLKLIEKKKSHWIRTEFLLKTDSLAQNILVKNFHRQMIQKAMASLDGSTSSERSVVSVTMPLSEKTFAELNQRIFEILHEFANRYSDTRNPKAVYQLNFQAFPLVKTSRESKE